MAVEQLPRAAGAFGMVVALREAREAQELVDERRAAVARAAARLRVRGAGIPRDELEVRLELRPARNPELTGDDELRVGAGEAGELRRAGLRVGEAGMELVDGDGTR